MNQQTQTQTQEQTQQQEAAPKWIFVYGTLLKNQPNHELMGKYFGSLRAHVPGYSLWSAGWFPVAMEQKGGTVFGEVYFYPDEAEFLQVIDRLDALEGVKSNDEGMYVRKVVPTLLTINNEQRQAWMYVGGHSFQQRRSRMPLVPGGHWLDFQRKQLDLEDWEEGE